jgi:predicted fused transcriptional regulator/phosphomethylpyrimidine kinase
MVSKYLRRPPRNVPFVRQELIQELVTAGVEETLRQEERGRVAPWCPPCMALSERGFYTATAEIETVAECLRHDKPVARDQQEQVLKALQAAEAWIRRTDLRPLQPAVRINLAMSIPNARDTRDVAAFPGRLVDLKGRVQAVSPPEFGSSTHLAQLLVRIQRKRPEIRSLLNLRHDDRVQEAASAAGLTLQPFKRSQHELMITEPARGAFDGFVDPGDFGVEPILYLVGERPDDVVTKARRLLEALNEPTRVKTQ